MRGKEKGITLIALVVTIVVLLILVGITVYLFMPGGMLDRATQAKFLTNYRAMEERVGIYKADKQIEEYTQKVLRTSSTDKLPLGKELSQEEKEEIREKIPSLAEEIIGRNAGQSLDSITLYEINKELIDEKEMKHKYIIDMGNEIIYDYEGESFFSRRWHTIEGIRGEESDRSDIYDGWIRLTLYYPDNSTDKKWLLKGEGEVREEDWKDYTGPIWVPLNRVQDVYIKYKIEGNDVIIPPSGKVGVVINPEKYEIDTAQTIKVTIDYSTGSTGQEYRIGNDGWKSYTGEFEVNQVGIIEARAKRVEDIYDGSGNKITTRETWGYDSVYIREKGTLPGQGNTGGIGDSVTGGSGSNTGGSSGGSDASGGSGSILPGNVIKAPSITVTPTEISNSVSVSVTPPVLANIVYIQVGNGKLQTYTGPIKITSNTTITAYYTTYKGETSQKAYKIIDNIQTDGKPYVAIHANPYPYANSTKTSEVEISISSKDAQRVEYSTDGVIYQTYHEKFKVKQNGTVYARAIQGDQMATDRLAITNIGENEKPNVQGNIKINIIASPDPMVTNQITDKVKIRIDYEETAKDKYYSIGAYGIQIPYTGEFEIKTNSTIYAYAKGDNCKGTAVKVIDNISTGIIAPQITADPTNQLQASKVKLTIQYDRNATVKRYSIDGGELRDYVAPIEVEKNCTIRAYNENQIGQKASSSYEVTNILPNPPPVLVDQGDYYILKLNYPQGSSGREYKIKETGTWAGYKEEGILLVKGEYKNKILNAQGNVQVQIKNEKGQMVTWGGTVYVLDGPINEIMEEISMRWDTVKPGAPQIVLSTEEPTREVEVSIIYANNLKSKECMVIEPDGSTKGWEKYKGSIKVSKKNTIVMARGQSEQELWGVEAKKQIVNIDEQQPVIKLTANLDKPAQKLGVKVEVTDDTKVAQVKWAAGVQGDSYFEKAGDTIANNSIVTITENGYYTFYAQDRVGNTQVYTLNVINIDLTAPKIQIKVDPENQIVLQAKIEIDYGDSIKKEYKVGEKTTTYTAYTGSFNIDAYDIINRGLVNEDKTVTIYAKGTDIANNVTTQSEKILNLDLDMPNTPVINSNYGYPKLTSYGVKFDGETTVTFDSRTDIDNYYSLDNGATWQIYTGQFEAKVGTIKAKSVKKSTGLTKEASKNIAMPADALGAKAYDSNTSTYEDASKSAKRINIDTGLQNKEITVQGSTSFVKLRVVFYDNNNKEISRFDAPRDSDANYTLMIPSNAVYCNVGGTDDYGTVRIYELSLKNEPNFSATNGYMLLHADSTKAIRKPYQMINISYFPTSVQRLYKIGTGEWKEYQDTAVKVNQGETIYAKGIDQYGNATKTVSSIVNVTDALGEKAYDGNKSTYFIIDGTSERMDIDAIMWNQKIAVYAGSNFEKLRVIFYNAKNQELTRFDAPSTNGTYTINVPSDAAYCILKGQGSLDLRIYEIYIK